MKFVLQHCVFCVEAFWCIRIYHVIYLRESSLGIIYIMQILHKDYTHLYETYGKCLACVLLVGWKNAENIYEDIHVHSIQICTLLRRTLRSNWTRIRVTEHVNVFDFDAISVLGKASPIWAFSINCAIALLPEELLANQITFRCRCDYNTDRNVGNEAANDANSASQTPTHADILPEHTLRKDMRKLSRIERT